MAATREKPFQRIQAPVYADQQFYEGPVFFG